MKKILLLFVMAVAGLSLSAQTPDAPATGYDSGDEAASAPALNLDMKQIVQMLQETQAYIFIGHGEERDVWTTFGRSEQIELGGEGVSIADYDWIIANESTAKLEVSETAVKVKGVSYGETFLIATEKEPAGHGENWKPAVHYFAVFVCPTVTVLSPEGTVYSYPKTYKQPPRLQLTSSPTYRINCVMCNGEDITDILSKGADHPDDPNAADGYYRGSDGVKKDLYFVISEESVLENDNSDTASDIVSPSRTNVQVWGNVVTFFRTDGNYNNIEGKTVTISDLDGKGTFRKTITDHKIDIADEGVYVLSIDGFNGIDYKVIIKKGLPALNN